MHLVQLLLPLYDNDGNRFPRAEYDTLSELLTRRFGGLTAYSRAPAEGLWREDGEGTKRDDIVIYEVMADALDEPWWADLRASLERRFQQERLVIRAQDVRLI